MRKFQEVVSDNKDLINVFEKKCLFETIVSSVGKNCYFLIILKLISMKNKK